MINVARVLFVLSILLCLGCAMTESGAERLLKTRTNDDEKVEKFGNPLMAPVGEDPEKKLSEAELRQKLEAFAMLRKAGKMSINSTDAYGETALSKAIRLNDTQAIAELLQLGADPNKCVIHHTEGLSVVAGSGNLPIAKLLIEHGAKIENMGDCYESTAFASACEKPGNGEMVEYFLSKGAIANAREWEGRPVIFSASNDNRLILLKHGANINMLLDGYGHNALDKEIDDIDAFPETETKAERVLFLLKHGCNPNNLEEGKTCLMRAVSAGRPDLVELIVQYGGSPKLKDREGKTAFDYIDETLPDAQKIRSILEGASKKKR